MNQRDIKSRDGIGDPIKYQEYGEVYFENGCFKVNSKLLGEFNLVLNPIIIGNIFESPELLDEIKIPVNIPKRGRGRPKKEIY